MTGKYKVGMDVSGGRVSRADVADFMIKAMKDDTWLNKCPSLIGWIYLIYN